MSRINCLQPQLSWYEFDGKSECLRNSLGLGNPHPPALADRHIQLTYLERYADELRCKSFAVEQPYFDRDYIEDHSAFYAKSLYPYPNYCRRVHFFAEPPDVVRERLQQAVQAGKDLGRTAHQLACQQISEDIYLGFSVIKPLDGTPVGRTVLRCFPSDPPAAEYRRHFRCIKRYFVHFSGCELTVDGLAFQQQDLGVSACATTALWCALQKTADDEPIAAMTPVQITQMATKHSLARGRPMPSSGLTLEQMCNALQACGVSPNVFAVKKNHSFARMVLRAAIESGFAPVLLISQGTGAAHAITAVGYKEPLVPTVVQTSSVDHGENRIIGLYVHDDRLGPYLRCELEVPPAPNEPLQVQIRKRSGVVAEYWDLDFILVPMHPKIRLSFANLFSKSASFVDMLDQVYTKFGFTETPYPQHPILVDCQIIRGFRYLETLMFDTPSVDASHIQKVLSTIVPARYLGVIHLEGPFFSPFDVLLDTTSTDSNLNILGIVCRSRSDDPFNLVARFLSLELRCSFVK